MVEEKEFAILNDVVVKKIFTNERVGKRLATKVINRTLGLNMDEDILEQNLEYSHPQIAPNINVVNNETDILLEHNDFIANIEINLVDNKRNDIKNKTYLCCLWLKQVPTSKEYNNLKKNIQINIDYFDYFNKDLFHYESVLTEKHTGIIETEDIAIHHLNLVKLEKEDYNKFITDKESLEKLLYFFVCKDKSILDEIYKGDKFMETLRDETDQIQAVLDSFLFYNKEELDRLGREDMMREGYEKGVEKGLEQGIKQGIEQGIEYNVPIGVDTLRRREPINCTQVEGIKSLKVDTNLWVL